MNLAFVALLAPAVLAVATKSPVEDDSSTTGIVSGQVVYRADRQRPWRYSRYYIKHAKTGELAEAVVALRARGSRSDPDDYEPQTHSIHQRNFQFEPEVLAIRAGDSVVVTNDDGQLHNVRSTSRLAEFDVNTPPGVDYTQRFERAGGTRLPVRIGCAFHGTMRAWIFVFDHPFYQITDAEGRFQFAHVPPGSYELVLTHPAGNLAWRQRVEVRAGETQTIDVQLSPDQLVR